MNQIYNIRQSIRREEIYNITFNVVFNVDVRHLLCIWHIANDVENMVDKLCGGKKNQQGQIFRQGRWNPLVESSTIGEFEQRWQAIVTTWSVRNKKVVRYLE